MTKLLSLGQPNSQTLYIRDVVEQRHPSRIAEASCFALRKGFDNFIQYVLAVDSNQGWRRPAHIRLERFEPELRSAFSNAGLGDFVNGTSPTLGYDEWSLSGSDSNATRNRILVSFINLKLGVNLNAHYLLQHMPIKSFEKLLPSLKLALVYQEVNRLVTTELGISETEVMPSLRLNPDKGQRNHSAINMPAKKCHEFIKKVAESFNINAEQLIKDFEASEYASLSSLWDAVLNQTSEKYGTNNPRANFVTSPV